MEKFGGDDYFKKSKYTRQVIFGKLNPKRTIYFEKYLIGTIFSHPENRLFRYLYDNTQLIIVKSDEIVFEIDTVMFCFSHCLRNMIVIKDFLHIRGDEETQKRDVSLRVYRREI